MRANADGRPPDGAPRSRAVVAFVLLAATWGVSTAAVAQDTVTAAALRDWPPYYLLDAEGRPTGFAIDSMDAVAERAGLEVRYRLYDDFPGAIDGFERGEVDLIPNMGVTEERTAFMDFTSPLETFDVVIFVRAGTRDISGPEDLAGHRVAVVRSNVGVEVVAAYGETETIVHEDVRTALYELLAGRVDALVYPRAVVLSLARAAQVHDHIVVVGPPLREVKRGIAVHSGDALLARLEPAVTDFADSSEYAAVYERWFTPAPPFWTAERVATFAGGVAVVALLLVLLWRYRVYRRIATEITGRRRAEEERQTTEGRYEKLMEQASDGIFIADPDGRYVDVNPRGCEMTGYSREELLQLRMRDLLPPEEIERRPLDLSELETGKMFLRERTFLRADGTRLPVEISATRLEDGSLQGIVRDISERLAAEEAIRHRDEQLRQSQKMEAIGRLAGGVAHDFNNLLTVILGNGETLRGELTSQQRDMLDEILEAGARAADLTRQLLAFSRKQVVKLEPLDVSEVLSNLRRMLERIIGEDIALDVDTAGGPHTILADRSQLEQVVLNLAVNARDAMPGGGELVIRCASEPGDDGGWVLLEVADTGHGMDEETLEHVFEPFYTTKQPGHGTGLGLATVHSIVEQASGRIEVDSAPGRGAVFRLRWPMHATQTPVAPRDAAVGPSPTAARHSILVVEDEPAVRHVVVRSLTADGFDVAEAAGPDEAIRLCEDGLRIDLLVTDIVMPSRSGVELAEQLMTLCPELRVLFVSGYPQQSLDDVLAREGRAFLAKPFTHAELVEQVLSLLEPDDA